MLSSRILISGVAGFIGFHIAKSLLKDGYIVYGVDNLNNYYNPDLKKERLNIISEYDNFKFKKVDITNYKNLNEVFIDFKPSKVLHLAAQAGVRYSLENPFAYLNSNLVGFMNIIELSKEYKVGGFIYASSSSIYGSNKKIPFGENDITDNPVSLYAATKKSNELIAHTYSHIHNLNTTGLRFFTVYGPWGRPDMAYFSFASKISSGSKINVYNNGNMKRDFTYIDDIVDGIKFAIDKNYQCEIFNLGNNKSENLMDLIKYIEKYLGINAKVKFSPMQLGDVKQTYANINKSKKMLKYKPKISLKVGLEKFIKWYKEEGSHY
tara:strand:+ start:1694 stop:2659 length:966 start_codon:yes stop_codon:yes gene_type:complete